MLHILLHFLIPALVAYAFKLREWIKPEQRVDLKQIFVIWLILCATMLVDLDHLLADPIYDPNRCSINFHPLHTYWAIVVYLILMVPRKTRIIAMGLLIHMALDWQDCHFKITFNDIF